MQLFPVAYAWAFVRLLWTVWSVSAMRQLQFIPARTFVISTEGTFVELVGAIGMACFALVSCLVHVAFRLLYALTGAMLGEPLLFFGGLALCAYGQWRIGR